MLRAVLSDLIRATAIQPLDIILCCHRHYAQTITPHHAIRIIPIPANTQDKDGFPSPWHTALQEADIVIPIAPEHKDILYRLTHMVEQNHIPLLTSASSAIAIASSKTKTTRHLLAHHMHAPPIIDMRTSTTSPHTHDEETRYCLKPDDGVGCLESFMAQGYTQLKTMRTDYPSHIVTLWVEGKSYSLTTLCAYGKAQLITCNRQHIHIDKETHAITLEKIDVGIPCHPQQWQRYQRLADNIAQCMPTLYGFVGIDIIDHDRQCVITDINPRITTSYMGLRHIVHHNPCDWLLTLHRTGTLASSYPRPHSTYTIRLKDHAHPPSHTPS